MKTKQLALILILLSAILVSFPLLAGTDGHEETGELKHRVNTERLDGLYLWLALLYNDHRLTYAVVTTLSMALFGAVVALVVDFILGRLGLTVSKMEHRE